MHRFTAGSLVVGIGVLHNLVGVAVGAPWLLEIVRDGVVGAVPDTAPWRMSIFWFLWFGWALMVMGASWHWMERQGHVLPRWLAGAFVAMGLGGAIVMPASGFWLVLPVGVLIWRRAPHARAQGTHPPTSVSNPTR